jgi:hypothetical protein
VSSHEATCARDYAAWAIWSGRPITDWSCTCGPARTEVADVVGLIGEAVTRFPTTDALVALDWLERQLTDLKELRGGSSPAALPCPVEGCEKTFTGHGWLNRHLKVAHT